jgi:hypothetical protein
LRADIPSPQPRLPPAPLSSRTRGASVGINWPSALGLPQARGT